MSDLPQREYFEEAEEQPPAPRRARWPTLVAWLVILLTVGARVALPYLVPSDQQAKESKMANALLPMQARYAVGTAQYFGQGPTLLAQMKKFNSGPLLERLRFAILAGELDGPKQAQTCLDQTRRALQKNEIQPKPGRDEVALLAVLRRLYRDYERGRLNAPSVSTQERNELIQQLGWFGELALAPAGKGPQVAPQPQLREDVLAQAIRTFWVLWAGIGTGLALGMAGLVLLVVFLILAASGKVRSALSAGILHGGVYAETFALWMAFFFGLSLVVMVMGIPEEQRLWWEGGVMLLSLAVLGWPVLRGVPWTQVRQDVGLTLGRRPALEPAAGIGCYLMSLPLLGIALMLLLIYLVVQQALSGGEPGSNDSVMRAAHPIVRELVEGDWGTRLFLLFLASVIAPIVEETIFRGVLYRHLREASRRLGTVGSFLVSAVVVSFLFAVIHPQGLIAVPLLMALAFGFALAREWRGSLLPGMVGHGLNNGLVFLFLILSMGA